MIADENKAIVRRFYDEVMDENFVDHGEAMFGSSRGREVLRQGIAATHSILSGMNIHLGDVIAEDDLVGVRGTMRCTHQGTFLNVAGTGNELSWKGLAIFRIVGGKIVERGFNSDSLSVVRQLGIARARPEGDVLNL